MGALRGGAPDLLPPAAPIVFLDIDGVICTRRAAGWPINRGRNLFTSVRGAMPPRMIDPAAIGRLDRICVETGAAIVVSSTWRLDRDARAIFRRFGLAAAFHEDWRTDSDGPARGQEIDRWIAAHSVPRAVIIDDKPVSCHSPCVVLVRTAYYAGLQDAGMRQAIDWLRSRAEAL